MDAWKLAQGQSRLQRALEFWPAMGRRPADFLWTTLPLLVCVSARTIAMPESGQFSGWDTYPATVHGKQGEAIEGCAGFVMTGPQLEQDLSRSTIVVKPPYPGGRPSRYYKGIFFDETGWDGSDFFWVRGSMIVTRRVKEAFERARITNVDLVPIGDVEVGVEACRFDK